MRFKMHLHYGFLTAMALSVIVGGMLVGCNKKHNSPSQSGGGNSNQSVVTVKGDAHAS
jgi:hypothetical protein